MVLDVLRYPVYQDHCVCNRTITSEPYYGLLGVEQDDIIYFDPGHPRCLAEWGLTLYPDDPIGVRCCAE